MEEVLLFIMTFAVLLTFYELFFVMPIKNNKKKKNNVEKKELLEIGYLKAKYNLDFDKIPYNQLLQICSITSCFDISLIVTIISFIDSFLWKIVVGIVSGVVLIIVSYYGVYLFYKRKGMILNGKHK